MTFMTIVIIATIALTIFIWFFISDGYLMLHYINRMLSTNNTEFFDTKYIQWCTFLRNNVNVIRQEYLEYNQAQIPKRFRDLDSHQEYVDTGDIPWQVIILKLYNKNTPNVSFFPKTFELVNQIPGCTLAMFSVLPPGKKLVPHYGPYKGVLRYHLTLIAPPGSEMGASINNCFLNVNGKNYIYKDNRDDENDIDVMFDDTFLHYSENNTKFTRVVLFLDIKREFNNLFLNGLNELVLYSSQYHSTVTEIVDKVSPGK